MGISGHAGDVMADRRYYDPETKTFLPGARMNIEQYEILKRCSYRDGDISEWQRYRAEHPDEEIWLCGADLEDAVLKSPGYETWRKNHEPQETTLGEGLSLAESENVLDLQDAHLEAANLASVRLNGANLFGAHLEDALFFGSVYLNGVDLTEAHLKRAFTLNVRLAGANLTKAHLQEAKLREAHLNGALLAEAHLDGADLCDADLTAAELGHVEMRGSLFRRAKVDGRTLIWGNHTRIDRRTDFTGVGLEAARVPPGIRQLLECNVRRLAWHGWFRSVPVSVWDEKLRQSELAGSNPPLWLRAVRGMTEYFKRLAIQPFWFISDYGRITWGILVTFFLFAAYFALAYCLAPLCLIVGGEVGALRGWWHALYFSIVTQTTLGFGDIHANPASPYGQLLLMLQVILGYVLLGALVTRFAVLFTAGGPAGRFSPRQIRFPSMWLYVPPHPRVWAERVPRAVPREVD